MAQQELDPDFYGTLTKAISSRKGTFFAELDNPQLQKLINQSLNYNIGHSAPFSHIVKGGYNAPFCITLISKGYCIGKCWRYPEPNAL